jgi:hypothetical protein
MDAGEGRTRKISLALADTTARAQVPARDEEAGDPQMPALLLLRLPRAALARRDAIVRLADSPLERSLFAFKCDELAFARALLERHPNWWLYRTNQRAFAGDFVAVDVSPPRREGRRVLALELKRGQRVRGIRLANAKGVVRELADEGVVVADASVDSLVGDARAVLDAIATPRRRTRTIRASGP